ncbi:MAG: hypothetical protein GTN86_13395 [Xanthomonadales bacterium]|nr:hypothetical protein [Xanthomonadales bacterium]NIN60720.1 hypothetical protein [Xanthomonadales bacterium]NIN76082.1 hypothetical protein [Xanthomonadales bacterium]NIO15303.1 hypothetical protein [Xanthomonadales bacterium]NIP13113.1 hypothetical protein [Xanthomonadales bacterium]
MDQALKQRLVGASVLIALAVIVLPMLLSGAPEQARETRRIEVPSRPADVSVETRRFPIGEGEEPGPPSLAAEGEDAAGAEGGAAGMETRAAVGEPLVADSGMGEEPKRAPAPAQLEESPVAVAPRYLVQVASFSSSGNASRLASRLSEDGMAVLRDRVETNAGTLHRVRVGPFETLESAQAAIARLEAGMPDLNPRVLDLRPEEGGAMINPSDPLVRWVVQVGSFAEEPNAQRLVSRLREGGYSAFAEAVTDTTGTVYKVRVGPEIERESALRIAEALRRDMALDGLVMSAD